MNENTQGYFISRAGLPAAWGKLSCIHLHIDVHIFVRVCVKNVCVTLRTCVFLCRPHNVQYTSFCETPKKGEVQAKGVSLSPNSASDP